MKHFIAVSLEHESRLQGRLISPRRFATLFGDSLLSDFGEKTRTVPALNFAGRQLCFQFTNTVSRDVVADLNIEHSQRCH